MLEIGKYSELTVKKKTDFGVFLDSPEGDVLLPRKYVPGGVKIGDLLKVFIYKDSEDRTIATTLTPKATVGEFAYLRVKEVTRIGAFLDWGLEKDLLVPYREQAEKMKAGSRYIVYLFLEEQTKRITATSKIGRFIEKEDIRLHEGEEVDLLVYRLTERGFKVIVNNRYFGMLYKNEIFRELAVGERARGFVKKIREDKRIDAVLTREGFEDIEEVKKQILKKLKESRGGFLPLTDESSPQSIREELDMSKKTFKKAIGSLYRDGTIEIKHDGIKLVRPDKRKILHKFRF
ncbi:MAG: GntR family transcriptional regulator [Alphaproteobacteria bacterium]|uniref:GntR family transcriptional regulator n=1 Tax=Candidatus Nitrobium versatile TaxID=2884831 RepID=A0A953M3D3_9BACT|nr:GntR family transcriptional regulator [Candidatus Nitrobium versatile]